MKPVVKFVHGNLLDCNDAVIVHQMNCVGVHPEGLSAQIAQRYQYSNEYIRRHRLEKSTYCAPEDQATPGTIVVSTPFDQSRGPVVVGLYAQYDCNPMCGPTPKDTADLRSRWFALALMALRNYLVREQLPSVAFPYEIGCGQNGGDWRLYSQMIYKFADNAPFTVTIYRS